MIGLLPILTRWRLGLSIAAALALLGLLGAANHYRHAYHAEKALRAADRAAYAAAQVEASRIARAAIRHTEAIYQAKAQEADHAYTQELADARTAADRYIAAHRVRIQAVAGDAGGTAPGAQGGGPGLRAGLPTDSFVAVSDADVQACSSATAYAVKLRDWAISIGE